MPGIAPGAWYTGTFPPPPPPPLYGGGFCGGASIAAKSTGAIGYGIIGL